MNANMLQLPPIKPIDNSKPFLSYHDPKAFSQYHHQPNHDTKKCYQLIIKIQYFIDNNAISIAGVNDKGNKFVAPNKNLQIFIN